MGWKKLLSLILLIFNSIFVYDQVMGVAFYAPATNYMARSRLASPLF